MSICQATLKRPKISAGMGQIVVGRQEDTLTAVLGSCLGVALFHPRCKVAALVHVVLPEASGRTGPPGKFADTAIPAMIDLLADEGALQGGLVAKIAGGADMFGSAKGPMQIGAANAAAVKELLCRQRIRILGEHLGGNKGRRIGFDCNTGAMTIEIVGCEPQSI